MHSHAVDFCTCQHRLYQRERERKSEWSRVRKKGMLSIKSLFTSAKRERSMDRNIKTEKKEILV